MSDAQRMWSQKSDEAVLAAANEISQYTEEGERVIREELRRRGLSEPPPLERVSGMNRGAMKRYGDGYRLAAATAQAGLIVQIVGAAAGVLYALTVPSGLTFGVGLAAGSFLAGLALKTQGHTLRASLDTAVSVSPFLNDSQKATMVLVAPKHWPA